MRPKNPAETRQWLGRRFLIRYTEYISGEVILDEDSTDYKWISVDELKNFDLIKGIDEEIQMVDEILKKRKKG